jgi:SnoaL-like domain
VEITDTLTIERACERLVLDFAYYSDHQQYESLAQLFAPDGVMHRPSGDPLTGHDAILQAYRARPAGRMTRHVCSNIRITVESADRARGMTYAVVYSATGLEKVEERIGEFEDDFVKTPEGWRFAVRRARFVMHM